MARRVHPLDRLIRSCCRAFRCNTMRGASVPLGTLQSCCEWLAMWNFRRGRIVSCCGHARKAACGSTERLWHEPSRSQNARPMARNLSRLSPKHRSTVCESTVITSRKCSARRRLNLASPANHAWCWNWLSAAKGIARRQAKSVWRCSRRMANRTNCLVRVRIDSL